VRRLFLVRHAPTPATRRFAFPADEPLDQPGRIAAVRFGALAPAHDETLTSPAVRCRQTVEAAGLASGPEGHVVGSIVPDLAECDFGAWAGRTLAEISDADADAVAAWMTDPLADPHGGESLAAFAARVGGWLEREAARDGSAIAITHGGVVKAAVVHALGAPLDAFWRIDASPLAITELHSRDGHWTLARVNAAPTR
jgi:broad specificity phosphatase PhoE